MPKVYFLSLGCPKNLVDSEQMLFLLDEAGFEIAEEPEGADCAIVNTCGFIADAKSEAIETILELAELKKEKKIGKIIMAGCLAERYREDIRAELPEVDGMLGCGSVSDIADVAERTIAGEKPAVFGDKTAPPPECGRMLTTPPWTAYVRISEGCDNACAYCAIPMIRGPMRSRKREDILLECLEFAESGIKELIIIAQDTTRYGLDIYGKRSLAPLLRDICATSGIEWVRLLYLYPDGFDDELIAVIRDEEKILKYLDIPVQHIDDYILKSMNRRYSGAEVDALFTRLRAEIGGLVLRTSVIAGLPGETSASFERLCSFLSGHRLERAGVFAYSREEGTPAALMDNQVEDEEKTRRRELIMDIQYDIVQEYNQSLVGKIVVVLCEGYDRMAGCYFGRSYAETPDIDGKIFFTPAGRDRLPSPGDFCDVLIEDVLDLDPIGKML